MKVQVLQHVPYEGIGCMESWLNNKRAKINNTNCYEEFDPINANEIRSNPDKVKLKHINLKIKSNQINSS